MEVNWSNPPARPGGPGRPRKYVELIEELQKHPGQWALVLTDVTKHMACTFRNNGCQTMTRQSPNDPKLSNIWARWPEE